MAYFRRLAALMLIFGLFACGPDFGGAADSGVRSIDSKLAYDVFRARLVTAIADNGLQIVHGACGKCSIKTFNAPANHSEIITVYEPGLTLAVFDAPDLKPVAEDLDRVFRRIVAAL